MNLDLEWIDVRSPLRCSFSVPRLFKLKYQQSTSKRSYHEFESTQDDERAGQITLQFVTADPDFNAMDQMRMEQKKIEMQGFRVHGAAVWPVEPIEGFQRGLIYGPTAEYHSHHFETPVVIFIGLRIAAIICLVGPAEGESIEWCKLNRWAFQTVCRSIQMKRNSNLIQQH